MKKIAVFAALTLCLTLLFGCAPDVKPTPSQEVVYSARFLTNAEASGVELTSGFAVSGESVMFDKQTVKPGEKLAEPAASPKRVGYDFVGWATDQDGTNLWNFDQAPTKNMTLYAKWERSQDAAQVDDYVEPQLSFVEQIDETTPFNLYGVLNSFVENDVVKLTRAGLRILSQNAADARCLLNYTRSSQTTVKEATYDGTNVSVRYETGSQEYVRTVRVSDVSGQTEVESLYEGKALRYETNTDVAPYNVVMAGSSSMENWSTSVVDMAPATTVNVGIGGTVVEQWTQKLCQRLIYPFNPRAVIFYVGINNIINGGKSGSETGGALVDLFNDVHLHLPNAEIYFIMINKVPGFTSFYDDIDVANDMVISYAASRDFMCLIDAGACLVKESGVTNSAYFLSDGLHMSLCGYVLWGQAVKDAFCAKEKEIYSK